MHRAAWIVCISCLADAGLRRYRYQLEAFVDKLKGRTPHYWMTAEDSVANMTWIERVYEKVRSLSCMFSCIRC